MQIQSKKYDMGIEKFFDILEEVKKEEQTTIGDCCVCARLTKRKQKLSMRHHNKSKKAYYTAQKAYK